MSIQVFIYYMVNKCIDTLRNINSVSCFCQSASKCTSSHGEQSACKSRDRCSSCEGLSSRWFSPEDGMWPTGDQNNSFSRRFGNSQMGGCSLDVRPWRAPGLPWSGETDHCMALPSAPGGELGPLHRVSAEWKEEKHLSWAAHGMGPWGSRHIFLIRERQHKKGGGGDWALFSCCFV